MSFQFNLHLIKSEIKNNLAISIPLIASQLIYASSGFVGTAMVAHLGKEALAASVLVSMIWFTLSVLFFGMLNAVGVLVSHQYGAKNTDGISNIMGQAYLLGVMVCATILSLLSCVPYLLQFCEQPPVVLQLATHYVYAWMWAIPALVILIITEQFLAGIGRAKIVLRISCIVVPIEIPLIYSLIFGKLGLPICGIAGIGYGFAITYTSTAIGLICYLLSSNYYHKFKIFSGITAINLNYLKELIRVGLPIGFMNVIEVSSFAVATLWMSHFGTSMLAAHQIVMQYFGFAITLVFAMSQAVTVRIGHAMGGKDFVGVRYAVYIGMMLNFSVVIMVALAFNLIPQSFLRLDLDIHAAANTELLQHTITLLSVCSVLLTFENFRIIGFGALRGLKDTYFPMYSSFVSFWLIGLSSAYIFAFDLNLQGKGIWWGLTLGVASGAIFILLRIRHLLRRVELDNLLEVKASRYSGSNL